MRPSMVLALLVAASWGLCLLLTTALCAAARRGDTQPVSVSEPAVTPPQAGPPEMSVSRACGDGEADRSGQAADLALQSG